MAGASSRFPKMRPKWLLTGADGDLMFRACLDGLELSSVERIAYVVREDHAQQFDAQRVIDRQIKANPIGVKHTVVTVPPTKSQPETVALGIRTLKYSGPIFIKDVDNRYDLEVVEGNTIAVADLNQIGRIHASNKSYVTVDDVGHATTIVEKSVVSNTFCVGGYGFAESRAFVETYERLQSLPDLFVSHIIYDMLLAGVSFKTRGVSNFHDWGTLAEWRAEQRRHAALFVDLDGTLVKNSSEFFEPFWGSTEAIEGNVRYINKLSATGKVKVYVTTSRKAAYERVTRDQLARIGLVYDGLLMGVPHARRFLINDFTDGNPFPTAVAINLHRNSEELEGMLTSFLYES
jgi:hypothetical protein